MKAQTLTPFELFGNQVRYAVPMFQRPYVWTKEDQWEPLWDDVRTLAERVLELPTNTSAAGVPLPPHFLGAIVLDQQLVPAAYIAIRHIVNGQQRLTTLQLLLDAAQWVMLSHGDSGDAAAPGTLILNNAAIAQGPDDVFKVWPTNHDRDAFRAVMRDDLTPDGELAVSQIALAHDFFAAEITEWAELEQDAEVARRRLHALALALMQYLKIVVIDLDPGDNAQVIFETLNHRGTPLLAADLVKNLVFQIAETNGVDTDALYDQYWERFDAQVWRRPIKQGRFYRPRIDVFLNYWMVMRRAKEVQTDHIFADFRDYVASINQPVTSVVQDLAANAQIFDGLERLPSTSVEGTFYYRVLGVMEQFVLGPLLLWLFRWPEERLSGPQRHRALRALESWLVRRMVCRMTMKPINRLVIDLLIALEKSGPETAGETIADFLASQHSESTKWPSDVEFRSAATSEPLYKIITRSRLRMVLEAAEDQIRSSFAEEQHCPRGKLTVEHILPQGWREHWGFPADIDSEALQVQRDRTLHTLGNLTLVNDRLNPAMSNRPWTDAASIDRNLGPLGKRSKLRDSSVLYLNKKIVGEWVTSWDEAAIQERAAQLSDALIAIWPNPA